MKKTLFSIGLALVSFTGFSQSSHQVNISISSVAELELGDENGISFSFANADAIEANSHESQTKSLSIQANSAWGIDVYASSNFIEAADETLNIPISVLTVNSKAIGIGVDNKVEVESGTAGSYPEVELSYDVDLGTGKWEYAAGEYSTTVYITMTTD